MTLTLTQVRKVIRQTANTASDEVENDPKFKFEVFYRVCTNLLQDGKITQAQYNRWVNVY